MSVRNNPLDNPNALDEATNLALGQIVRDFGTPTYAFSVQQLRSQVEKLRGHLPAEVEILYSLKANASIGICDILALVFSQSTQ